MGASGVVVIGFNAFRVGGSQTYAITLARILQSRGHRVILLGKRGDMAASASSGSKVIKVLWREGSADRRDVFYARTAFGIAEKLSGAVVRTRLRDVQPDAVIASQPWPIQHLTRWAQQWWPGASRLALVHGVSNVEWPPAEDSVNRLSAILTATDETYRMIAPTVSCSVASVGNIFRGELFWGVDSAAELRLPEASDPVLFLGTLTANKTPPLEALIEWAALSKDRRIVVVGGGPEMARLKRKTEFLDVTSRVHFMGALPDPRAQIEASSCVVAAGRAAIESASGVRPVICASAEGIGGVLTTDSLEGLVRCNFTGRAKGATRITAALLGEHIDQARALSFTELRGVAARLWQVGDVASVERLAFGHGK